MKTNLWAYTFELDNFIKGRNNKIQIYIEAKNIKSALEQLEKKFGEIMIKKLTLDFKYKLDK